LKGKAKISGYPENQPSGEHMAIVVSRPDARQYGVELSVVRM